MSDEEVEKGRVAAIVKRLSDKPRFCNFCDGKIAFGAEHLKKADNMI